MSQDNQQTLPPSNDEYDTIISEIRKTYKPTLKALTKNELIKLVVELSAHVAALKAERRPND